MTRLFSAGAESGNNSFWTSGNPALVSATNSSYLLMTGNYSYVGGGTKSFQTPLTEFYYRARYCCAYPQRSCELVAFNNASTKLGSIRADPVSGCIFFSTGSGAVITALGAIWLDMTKPFLLEVYFKLSDSVGRVIVKIDGNVDIDYSGDTKPGTASTIDNFSTSGLMSGGGTIAIDDIAVNDVSNTDGLDNNSWCGDGYIIGRTLYGNGDVSQLTGSDGNSVDNYQLVDEVPVSSSPDDYVGSVTADIYDLYHINALGLTNVAIRRVWLEAIALDTVAAGGLCQLGLKVDGSENWSASFRLLTTNTFLTGPQYQTKPGGTAWSISDISTTGLQVGFKVK